MDPVRASLIGTGGYGRKIARAVSMVPSLRIVSCYHPDPDKAQNAVDEIGCRAALQEKEAVCNDDIEAVIIATPDHTHDHYIQLAMEAGRHIFVEKPMVSALPEAIRLKEKLISYEKVFCVGHNIRREPAIRFLKDAYSKGSLGELVTFQIILSHGGAFNWANTYWRAKPEYCREGPMRVNGVHASDVLEYLFGPIDSVYATIESNFAPHQTPDSGVAIVQIGKTCGVVSTHWVVPSLNRFHFQFTNAVADFDLHKLTVRYGRDINCQPTPEQEIQLPVSDTRIDQMKEFAGAIRGENDVETGWQEGFRAVMFFEACYQSSMIKAPVRLEELPK